MIRYIIAFMLLLSAPSLMADERALWLNMGGVSWHPGTSGMNGRNPGIGVELELDKQSFIAAGKYRNSLSQDSHYIVYGWRPYEHGSISGGAFAGVIDGYKWRDGRMIPMAAPYMMIKSRCVALNLIFIPKVEKHVASTVALQVKFKIK
ncbi:MAG: hypothetical protein HY272_01820 [Gammaproteobacteria bacterium]|nr:hypothetical protein [Gammaproteobacteria bacterium]